MLHTVLHNQKDLDSFKDQLKSNEVFFNEDEFSEGILPLPSMVVYDYIQVQGQDILSYTYFTFSDITDIRNQMD